MNRWCIRLTALASLAVAASAFGHDETYSAQWCRFGEIIELGPFSVGGPILQTFKEAGPCPNPGVGRDCGVFDDDYYAARTFLAAHCTHLAGDLVNSTSIHSIVPVVTGPAAFLSDDHHSDYDAASGVWGVCLACDMSGTPAPPTTPGGN